MESLEMQKWAQEIEARIREAKHAAKRAQLGRASPPHFRIWRRQESWELLLGKVMLLGAFIWFLLDEIGQRTLGRFRAKRFRARLLSLAEDFRQCLPQEAR